MDSNDKRGGLGLLWKNDIQASLGAYNDHMIDVDIKEDKEGTPWQFTGFYEHLVLMDKVQ